MTSFGTYREQCITVREKFDVRADAPWEDKMKKIEQKAQITQEEGVLLGLLHAYKSNKNQAQTKIRAEKNKYVKVSLWADIHESIRAICERAIDLLPYDAE